jgi:hypothetical protein
MATEKKNLFLAHEVHVLSGEKPEKPGDPLPIKTVKPGLLSEVGLSDKEIKSLPRGTIRPATADEIEGGEQRARAAEARELAAQQQQEQRDAEIERQNERRAVERETEEEKRERLAKLEAQQEKDRVAEQKKAADELNKAQGIKTPQKASR